jgi:hypothetical protein
LLLIFVAAMSAAAVAYSVGLMTYRSATAAVNQQYVALAIGVLNAPLKDQPDVDLRKWAVETVNATAPIKLSPALASKLSGGAVSLTTATGTLTVQPRLP